MAPRDGWEAYALPGSRKGAGGTRLTLRAPVTLGGSARAKSEQRANRGVRGLTGPGFEERTTWVHVAPPGTWEGHAEGAFTLGAVDFDSIVDHDQERPAPISWDYEHASIAPDGDATPGAGFVVSVEHRPDGLWAETEFTKRAAKYIGEGEYRFCSGVFDFDAVDPVTGKPLPCVMDSIALTNRPFIAGMEPIMLTRTAGSSRRRAAAGDTSMPMEKPATTPSVKFSRKMLDRALNELETDSLTESSVRLIMDGLMAQARARAALTEGDAPPVEDDDDAEEVDASLPKPKARAASVAATGSEGAPQDPSQPPDIAPPTPSISVPPGQGAPGASEAGIAASAAAPPIPLDAPTDSVGALVADLATATGLDEEGLLALLREKMDALVGMLTGTAPTTLAAEPSDEAAALVLSTVTRALRDAKVTINKYETERRAASKKTVEVDAETAVELLVKDGKIHPAKAERAPWVALARSNPKAFRAASAQLEAGAFPVREADALPPAVAAPTPPSENVPTPPADAAVVLDETSEDYLFAKRACDTTDKELQKLGRPALTKEKRQEMIVTTLRRAGKIPAASASRGAN